MDPELLDQYYQKEKTDHPEKSEQEIWHKILTMQEPQQGRTVSVPSTTPNTQQPTNTEDSALIRALKNIAGIRG